LLLRLASGHFCLDVLFEGFVRLRFDQRHYDT
jgi:hypothetical protein